MLNRGYGPNRLGDIEELRVEAGTPLLSAKSRHLFDWWCRAGGGGAPPRTAFDIVEHRPIIANIFVTQVRENGSFAFRLMGEEAIAIVGRNATGEVVGRDGSDVYGHELHTYYRQIVLDGRPRVCRGVIHFSDAGRKRFESIDCPLADAEGRIDSIIGVMDII
jgi:hypothetical protein